MLSISLINKVALITGGSKGIGLGIAEAMMEEGMRVAITGRNPSSLSEALEHLSQLGTGEAMGITADVRSLEDQEKAVAELLGKWGQLDVLIANAGVGHFAPIDQLSPEQWHETIDINLTGVFYSVKASLDALKTSKGYIITIASLAGANFFAGGSAYNASKFGLVGFTQAIMLDLRNAGIKTTTIMPGSVATSFNKRTPTEADAWKNTSRRSGATHRRFIENASPYATF